MEFKTFLETSINTLYNSTVAAFPNTTMRQHATDPIVITNLKWVPFVGMKTLFIKGLAQNEGREYNSIALFKQVEYNDDRLTSTSIIASDNKEYQFNKLSLENNDVLVRCNCDDFFYRFNYYNHLDKSLYNRKRKKYESQGGPSANPKEMPGMCKHLIKLIKVLQEAGIFNALY